MKALVRVNSAGCLDLGEHAAVLVAYPEAVWCGFVRLHGAEEIVQGHLLNGRPVERLRLPKSRVDTRHRPHKAAGRQGRRSPGGSGAPCYA